MITIHIITDNEETLQGIAAWLLREKLVYENVDIDFQDTFVLENDEVIKSKTFKLQARTKALLFSQIESGLRETFKDKSPFLYSTPIVNMDAVLQKELILGVLKA